VSEPETARLREIVLLRSALRATTGNPELDLARYEGLAVGIHGDPVLERIYREETAPEQAELDLRISGESVERHATNASRFASFVQRVSQATKFTAKQLAGVDAHGERLLIEGVTPGSVRVVLRAPSKAEPNAEPHPDIAADSSDSLALKAIARILTNASVTEDEPDSDSLLGLVQNLTPPARRALKGAATDVIKAGWEITGTVRQRRQPEEPVQVTQRGAARLRDALHFNPGEPQTEVRIGFFDGLKVSAGVVFFIPTDGTRRLFSAAATDEERLLQVARLVAERDERGHPREVRAKFLVFVEDAEPGVPFRRSRVLESVTPLDVIGEQPFLNFA